MGDNWDDEDFEPEAVAPPPAPVEQPIDTHTVPAPQPQTKTKPKYGDTKEDKTYVLEDLGRELTYAEREEMQRKVDRAFARELLGADAGEEEEDWKEAATKEEFEKWGDKIAKWATQRHKAAHYGDFLSKLLIGISGDLEATDIRKMSNLLKQIADDKKKETDKAKPVAVIGKKKAKAAVKSTGGKQKDDFDDFGAGGGSGWRNEEDEDFM
ncbi:unnamed protein product, partial [Mesorhabditis belari]|uniref:Eukaryotic translation initiation factor 3 30 kDa subunit n=1 Tax=Mesorhabditis belari TaxID=2138241 RepID=A0AAF3J2Y6_9BILA